MRFERDSTVTSVAVQAGVRVSLVELSRRNLETLLAKLDGAREGWDSACTLVKQEELGVGDAHVLVRAVENEVHYTDRPSGLVFIRGEVV